MITNFQHIQVRNTSILPFVSVFLFLCLLDESILHMMCQLKTKHIAIASSKNYVAIATYVCTYVCTYCKYFGNNKFDGENIDSQHLRPPVLAILLETNERENFNRAPNLSIFFPIKILCYTLN